MIFNKLYSSISKSKSKCYPSYRLGSASRRTASGPHDNAPQGTSLSSAHLSETAYRQVTLPLTRWKSDDACMRFDWSWEPYSSCTPKMRRRRYETLRAMSKKASPRSARDTPPEVTQKCEKYRQPEPGHHNNYK